MFKDDIKRFKNALIIGTGGGNDIVSATLVASYLHKYGIKTDVAGILSPGAVHFYNGKPEQTINQINGEVTRYINSSRKEEIRLVDSSLPKIIKEAGINIDNFYNFSIRYGTEKLTQEVSKLAKNKGYDLIVGVDVGGDILARGEKDTTLLSPIMDFSTLQVISNLNIETILIEFGLGTDGELRPIGMNEIINELTEKKIINYESNIYSKDAEIEKFKQVYNKVKIIRPGNTISRTLRSLEPGSGNLLDKHKITFYTEPGEKNFIEVPIIIPKKYFGKVYSIDPKKLAMNRKKTVFSFENILEQFVKLKRIYNWHTEMDMYYLWDDLNWTTNQQKNYSLKLLTPCSLMPEPVRANIISKGFDENADFFLTLKMDSELLPKNLRKADALNFDVSTNNPELRDLIKEIAEQVISYQNN